MKISELIEKLEQLKLIKDFEISVVLRKTTEMIEKCEILNSCSELEQLKLIKDFEISVVLRKTTEICEILNLCAEVDGDNAYIVIDHGERI